MPEQVFGLLPGCGPLASGTDGGLRGVALVEIGSIAMELISSGPGFEAGFERHFAKIPDNRKALAAADFPAWCAELQAKYVSLRPATE